MVEEEAEGEEDSEVDEVVSVVVDSHQEVAIVAVTVAEDGVDSLRIRRESSHILGPILLRNPV